MFWSPKAIAERRTSDASCLHGSASVQAHSRRWVFRPAPHGSQAVAGSEARLNRVEGVCLRQMITAGAAQDSMTLEEGIVDGAKVASTLGVMASVLDIDKLESPCDQPVYCTGFYVALALSILAASAVCPAQLFCLVMVLGDGACLFNATCVERGEDPAELRRRVVQHLVRTWDQPCSAAVARRGHARGTVGEALAAEHGRAFADGAAYATWMAAHDAHGCVQWSTMVEACALATVLRCVVQVWTRTPDGGLAIRDVLYPDCAPTGEVINLVHGSHGGGGGHFDCLLPLASLSPQRAAAIRSEAMGVSASAWGEARLDAAAAAMVRLSRESAACRRDAEEAASGAAALGTLARAALEMEMARQLEERGLPYDIARDAAANLVAREAMQDPWDAVALLADTARLRRAVGDFLLPASAAGPAPAARDSCPLGEVTPSVAEADDVPELDLDSNGNEGAAAVEAAAPEGRGGSRADVCKVTFHLPCPQVIYPTPARTP